MRGTRRKDIEAGFEPSCEDASGGVAAVSAAFGELRQPVDSQAVPASSVQNKVLVFMIRFPEPRSATQST